MFSHGLNHFKDGKWLNGSFWPIDGTQTDTTTLPQSGPGSHDNEGVLHIPQSSKTGVSRLDAVSCNTQDIHWGGASSTAEIQSMYPIASLNIMNS